MNYFAKKIRKDFILEVVKWVSVMSLLMTLMVINYLYYDCNIYFRIIFTIVIVLFVILVLMSTKFYKLIVLFGKESYVELQKVLWPTSQESMNTTLIVIIVTIVLSLILWGLDTILVSLISFGLRL